MAIRYKHNGKWETAGQVYHKSGGKWVTAMKSKPKTRLWTNADFNVTETGIYQWEYTIKPGLRQYFVVGDSFSIKTQYEGEGWDHFGSTPIPGIVANEMTLNGTISGGVGYTDVMVVWGLGPSEHIFRTHDNKPIPIKG